MNTSLDFRAELLFTRWARAVDLLWRATVARRRLPDGEERRRAERRARNLQRIVRRALSEYHRIEVERQRAALAERRKSNP
jgi:hypothetical protein